MRAEHRSARECAVLSQRARSACCALLHEARAHTACPLHFPRPACGAVIAGVRGAPNHRAARTRVQPVPVPVSIPPDGPSCGRDRASVAREELYALHLRSHHPAHSNATRMRARAGSGRCDSQAGPHVTGPIAEHAPTAAAPPAPLLEFRSGSSLRHGSPPPPAHAPISGDAFQHHRRHPSPVPPLLRRPNSSSRPSPSSRCSIEPWPPSPAHRLSNARAQAAITVADDTSHSSPPLNPLRFSPRSSHTPAASSTLQAAPPNSHCSCIRCSFHPATSNPPSHTPPHHKPPRTYTTPHHPTLCRGCCCWVLRRPSRSRLPVSRRTIEPWPPPPPRRLSAKPGPQLPPRPPIAVTADDPKPQPK